MREHEADPLVEQLVNIWPSGPKAGAWYQVLKEFDAALVAKVIDVAMGTEHRISVARFKEMCRDHGGARPELPKCARCDTTGWVEAEPLIDRNHVYSQVEPCVCPAGKIAEVTRNRITA